MDASKGLRAVVLAIFAVVILACTDPGAGAGSSAQPSAAPAGESAAPSAAPGGESAAPSAPSGPDDYEY